MRFVGLGLVGFLAVMGLVGLIGGSSAASCSTSGIVEPDTHVQTGSFLNLDANLVASGLDQPTAMFQIPGDGRFFIAEKPGRIVVVSDGGRGEVLFDMTALVTSEANEQGLLSVIPDHRFAETCLLYVFYTDVFEDSVLASIQVRIEDDQIDIDPRTRRILLEIPQDRPWHQSGSLVFDASGALWISIGDGGGIGDPDDLAQNTRDLRGSLLRIQPDTNGYSIPPDNGALDQPGARPEIWAYGLRNPWRISIDQPTGLLYLPDVGQNEIEEVNIVSTTSGGLNFGWPITEGSRCYEGSTCDTEGVTLPRYEYEHEGNGCAIVGGSVYRGQAIPELDGHYFFADFCGGWVRSFYFDGSSVTEESQWGRVDKGRLITSFATDAAGEIYYLNLTGELWKVIPIRE